MAYKRAFKADPPAHSKRSAVFSRAATLLDHALPWGLATQQSTHSWYALKLGFRQDAQALVSRWPLLLLPCLIAGLASPFALDLSAVPVWLSWLLALITGLVLLVVSAHKSMLRLALLALLVLISAQAWMQWRIQAQNPYTLSQPLYGKIITGQLRGLRVVDDKVQLLIRPSALAEQDGSPYERAPQNLPKLLRVSQDFLGAEQLASLPQLGSTIRLKATVFAPAPPVIPAGYDPQRRAYFQNIGGFGVVQSPITVLAAPARWDSLMHGVLHSFDQLRFDLQQRFLADYGTQGAILSALLLGLPQAIPEEVLEDMRVSGLAHLLAISGLHVGMVAMSCFLLLRYALMLIGRRLWGVHNKKLAALGTAVLILFYVMLAGASVPTLRAYFMLLFLLVAVAFDRQLFSARLLGLAALVLLIFEPVLVIDTSFQMSFSAVIMLMLTGDMFKNHRDKRREQATQQARELRAQQIAQAREIAQDPQQATLVLDSQPPQAQPQAYQSTLLRLLEKFFAALLTSASATAGTMMVSLFTFGRSSWLGIVANAFAVPLTTLLILPLGLLALLLLPLGLERWLLELVSVLIKVLLEWAAFIADLPFGLILTPQFSAQWLLVFSVLLWLSLIAQRLLRALLIGAMALSCLFALESAQQPDLLIDADGQTLGFRFEQSLYVSKGTQSAYTPNRWGQALGHIAVLPWKDGAKQPLLPGLTCDAQGCLWQHKGLKIAIPNSREAWFEDCMRADILIYADYGLLDCRAEQIDLGALKQNGALAITFKPKRRLQFLSGQSPDYVVLSDRMLRHSLPWVNTAAN